MTIWIVVIGVAQVEDLADKTRGKAQLRVDFDLSTTSHLQYLV